MPTLDQTVWSLLGITVSPRIITCPQSESPSLLAGDEHSKKKSMKSQSVKTEREKKLPFFFFLNIPAGHGAMKFVPRL